MKHQPFLSKTLAFIFCTGLSIHASARVETKPEAQAKPFYFIENKGQLTDQYSKPRADLDAKLSVPGMNIFVGDGAIHYQWNRSSEQEAVGSWQSNSNPNSYRYQHPTSSIEQQASSIETYRMDVSLVGANKNALLIKEEEAEYYENYYLPQFDENGAVAHSFSKMTYKNVYPNIDWVIYTKDGQLKYDFIVHPGGNPKGIKLKYEGATFLSLKDGSLVAATPYGTITEQKPYSYTATGQPVASEYLLRNNTLSFDIGEYEGMLVIDPNLYWATYFGGSNTERSCELAADAAGNSYLCGMTNSSNNIATTGAHQSAFSGNIGFQDGFVVKFNVAGTRQWSTYYGNTDNDFFYSVTTDAAGNVYCGGQTYSSSGIATTGAQQINYGGASDDMLVKFSGTGARIWATYYGGLSTDYRQVRLTCDNSGNVFMSCNTASALNIATNGAYQNYLAGGTYDTYLVKFSASGVRQWATYFGGTGYEENWGIACDGSGNVYIAGCTGSTSNIATTGAYQTTYGGGVFDGYIAKFSSTGAIVWGTYYGGSDNDYIHNMTVDNAGNIYCGGLTYSSNGIATTGAYQASLSGSYTGFVTKFNTSGVRQWGTYYAGSSGGESIFGISVNSTGYLYVTGATASTSGIATAGAYQTSLAGSADAFLLAMNPGTGYPVWGTYFGGSGNDCEGSYETDYGNCAWSPAGYVFISGNTYSTSGIATTGAHQASHGGGSIDAFVASFVTDTMLYVLRPYIDTVFCPGDSFKVAYGITYNFNPGNVFTVQLSDASGSFASPVNIGSKTSTTADTIKCQVPFGTPGGSGYRIRIVSSNPVRVSADDGVNIRIESMVVNATSNSPVCVGDTLKLSVTTSAPSVTYSWAGPGSYTAGVQNPNILNVQTAHAGDYVVTVITQGKGCIVKDTTTVMVNTIPAVPAASNNSPLCLAATLNLTASSATAGVSYSWTGPAAFGSALQNPSISNVNTTHAGVYSVTATKNGCTSTAGITTVLVNVTPAPVAGGNNVLCGGASLNLTSSAIPGATYAWTGPNNFNSTQQNPVINPAHAWHSGPYIVKAIVNGCVSEPDTVVVVVNVVSDIGGWASPNDTICEGEKVTFVATPTNGGPSPVYQWYKNFVAIPGANSLLYTTSVIANGDRFHCTMYSVGVCTDPLLVSTDTIKMVIINITITPTAYITSNPAKPLPGQQVTFFANVVNGGYQPTYQWQRNGQNVIGAINANWSASSLHPYDKINCIVTSSDACASPKIAYSDTIIVNFPTGVNDKHAGNLHIYPNPVKDELIIEGIAKGTVIILYDIIGRQLYHTVTLAESLRINTTSFAPGNYVLQLSNAEGREVVKIVKE